MLANKWLQQYVAPTRQENLFYWEWQQRNCTGELDVVLDIT